MCLYYVCLYYMSVGETRESLVVQTLFLRERLALFEERDFFEERDSLFRRERLALSMSLSYYSTDT